MHGQKEQLASGWEGRDVPSAMSKGERPGPLPGTRPLGGRSKGEGGGRQRAIDVGVGQQLLHAAVGDVEGRHGRAGPCSSSAPGPKVPPPPWPSEGIDGAAGGAAECTIGKSNGDAAERMPLVASCLSMRSNGDGGQLPCGCQLPSCPLFCCCN